MLKQIVLLVVLFVSIYFFLFLFDDKDKNHSDIYESSTSCHKVAANSSLGLIFQNIVIHLYVCEVLGLYFFCNSVHHSDDFVRGGGVLKTLLAINFFL